MVRVALPASTGMELGPIMRVWLVEAELVKADAAGMLIGLTADDCDAFFPDEDMA